MSNKKLSELHDEVTNTNKYLRMFKRDEPSLYKSSTLSFNEKAYNLISVKDHDIPRSADREEETTTLLTSAALQKNKTHQTMKSERRSINNKKLPEWFPSLHTCRERSLQRLSVKSDNIQNNNTSEKREIIDKTFREDKTDHKLEQQHEDETRIVVGNSAHEHLCSELKDDNIDNNKLSFPYHSNERKQELNVNYEHDDNHDEFMRLQRREVHLLRELRDRTLALRKAEQTIRKLQEQIAQRDEHKVSVIEENLQNFPSLTPSQRQLIQFDDLLKPLLTHAKTEFVKNNEEEQCLEECKEECEPWMESSVLSHQEEEASLVGTLEGGKRDESEKSHNTNRLENAVWAFVNRSLKSNLCFDENDRNVSNTVKEFAEKHLIENWTEQARKSEEQLTNGSVNASEHIVKNLCFERDSTDSKMLIDNQRTNCGNLQTLTLEQIKTVLENKTCVPLLTRGMTTASATAITTASMTTPSLETTTPSSSESFLYTEELQFANSRTHSNPATVSIAAIQDNTLVDSNRDTFHSSNDNGNCNAHVNNVNLLMNKSSRKTNANSLRKQKMHNNQIAVSAPSSNQVKDAKINLSNIYQFLTENNDKRISLMKEIKNWIPDAAHVESQETVLPLRRDNVSPTYTLPPFYGYSQKSQTHLSKDSNFDVAEDVEDCAHYGYEM